MSHAPPAVDEAERADLITRDQVDMGAERRTYLNAVGCHTVPNDLSLQDMYDPLARGLILGLTLSHGRGHLYRALLESIGYGVRHILEALELAGGAPTRFVAVGGGTKGGLWTQIVSDVTGRPQEIPAETVGACYGDALLAAIGAGLVPADTTWATVAETVEPDPACRAIYDELYGIYRSPYPATVEQAHALARLQIDR